MYAKETYKQAVKKLLLSRSGTDTSE